MNRQEHMDWCKTRALEELDYGGPQTAVTSMLSDLGKHPDTKGHQGIGLTMMLMMGGHLDTADRVREHIRGFNWRELLGWFNDSGGNTNAPEGVYDRADCHDCDYSKTAANKLDVESHATWTGHTVQTTQSR